MESMEILIRDAAGIYIPKEFASFAEYWNVTDDAIAVLKAGPNHEGYWETWEHVYDVAYTEVDGHTYVLFQDGDLWAIREDKIEECLESWQ